MGQDVIPVLPLSREKIDQLAHEFLEKFDPEMLKIPKAFDIDSFFWHHLESYTGVKPDIAFDLPSHIEGSTITKSMVCKISINAIDNAADSESGRRRLRATLTHETCHCKYHTPQIRELYPEWESNFNRNHLSPFLNQKKDLPAYRDPEWQAWRWASYVMMPTPSFVKAISKRNTINMLVNIFDLNPAFIKCRCRSLGIKYTARGSCKIPRAVLNSAGL